MKPEMKLCVAILLSLVGLSSAQNCIENSVQLVGGSSQFEGRVEVCVGGNWGTVCDDLWDYLDAIVVCRQLSFMTLGAVDFNNAAFGPGTGDIVLDDVRCIGTELSLTSCTFTSSHNCVHAEDASVRCQPPSFVSQCIEPDLRLVDGTSPLEGRVEICINGIWGTVCDDAWDAPDANVVCNQLNFSSTGAVALSQASFGQGTGPIYLDDVNCGGTESRLSSCQHTINHNCVHSEDAGVRCMLEPCQTSNCTNGGTCTVSASNMALCSCPAAFTGLYCETALCLLGSCQNGGTCTERIGATPMCTCPPGYTGPECQVDMDFCTNTTCQNGGTCMEGLGNLTSCACPNGYMGDVCQTDVDFCTLNTCLNGGMCVEGIGILTSCTCLTGFTGSACEIDLDFCTATTCQNGGTCMEGLGNLTSCICAHGYTGATCLTDLDFCTPDTCRNGGTCAEGAGNLTSCACAVGFAGSECEVDLDFCMNTTCLNGGTCMEGRGNITSCDCPNGFFGASCETDLDFCTSTRCLNGGTCVEGSGSMTSCICPHGFGDYNCAADLDFCNTTMAICQNGGTCNEEIGNLTSCTCPRGFSGEQCEIDANFCVVDQCKNGGVCVEGIGTLTTCSCAAGFIGNTCEQDLDFCTTTTCRNAGICMEGFGTSTMCNCAPGFSGARCETDLNYCTSITCRNGGTCVEGSGRNTSCVCPPEFTGPVCSISVEEESIPCPAGRDSEWMLLYPELMPGNTFTHRCSEISDSETSLSGITRRECLGNGEWGQVDVSSCQSEAFMAISMDAQMAFSRDVVDPFEVEAVLQELVVATHVESNDTVSQFPQDLQTANNVLNMTVNYLIDDLTTNPSNPIPLSVRIVEVINNVLETNNEPGWQAFAETEIGSEMLLSNAEKYGQYFAQALMNENVNVSATINETMAIVRDNIIVQAQFVNPNDINDILFPMEIDPDRRTKFGSAQSVLTEEFLISRGAMSFTISAVNIIMDNLQSFLPVDVLNSTVQPATSIISTQLVAPLNSTVTDSKNEMTSAQFRFTTKELEEGEIVAGQPICAFWKFGNNLAESSWSDEGVETEITAQDEAKGTFDVICRSTHLTSFAVLLDVNNALSEIENQALTIITIIGCAISIVFLVITILFLILVIRKSMFTSVHYFIHLNLSIALLLGYVVFLAGIDTAVGNRIGCAFVAGLLHYLFTAVFCWMLCEGIMLYLMLVVVFSSISKKWWLFFLLGWVPPLFIVAISVGIIHNQYGTDQYCWISVEDPKSGAIWAFAVPMLFVIIVNTFFLVAALCSLFKVRRAKMRKGQKHDNIKSSRNLFRQLLVASIVLLPLLGLTWVFGLLSVNRATTFFAWIFTILNSLQGLFIFIFHVLRSDKVWGRLCRKKHAKRTESTRSTSTRITSTSSINRDSRFSRSSMITYGKKAQHEMSTTITEQEGDNTKLLDINLSMFSEEGEEEFQSDPSDVSVQEEEPAEEVTSDQNAKNKGQFGYVVTFNWRDPKNED